MANIFGRTRAMDEARLVPSGDTIGSYTSYLDAQKAVDYLADVNFPVQHVSIVGNDLKMVERVTGKLSYPRVALNGALTGAWFGLFIGVLLSFFDGNAQGEPYLNVFTSVLLGAAFWMLFGIIGYAAQRGKRDFSSTNQVLASNYDVIVDPSVSMEARRLLAQLPMKSNAAQHQGQPGNTGSQQHNPYQPNGHYGAQQPPREQQHEVNGQAPQRPESWNDPYGRQNGEGSAPADQPAEGTQQATGNDASRPDAGPTNSDAQLPANENQGHNSESAVRGRFPDLPDGRPQYGVRTDGTDGTNNSGSQDNK